MVCGRTGSVWWMDIAAEKRGRDFRYWQVRGKLRHGKRSVK
jgi:hypothetical protein